MMPMFLTERIVKKRSLSALSFQFLFILCSREGYFLRIAIVERGQERGQESPEIRYGSAKTRRVTYGTGGHRRSSGGPLVRVTVAVPGSLE